MSVVSKVTGTFTSKSFWLALLKDVIQEGIKFCAIAFAETLVMTLKHHFNSKQSSISGTIPTNAGISSPSNTAFSNQPQPQRYNAPNASYSGYQPQNNQPSQTIYNRDTSNSPFSNFGR